MRIGLFGGSFDPPHEGHLLVSRIALTRLRLDRLWWLVSPGNPLKDASALPSLEARIAAAQKIVARSAHRRHRIRGRNRRALHMRHASIIFTPHCPGVRFVWIMGADNLLQFHRWRRWKEIARTTPIAIIDRPGATFKAVSAKARSVFRRRAAGRKGSARCSPQRRRRPSSICMGRESGARPRNCASERVHERAPILELTHFPRRTGVRFGGNCSRYLRSNSGRIQRL